MVRAVVVLLSGFLTCGVPGLISQEQPTQPAQDIPVVQTPQPSATETQPSETDRKGNDDQKQPSNLKRKVRGALPDCVNIIFSKCWSNDAREQEAAEKVAERRAHAAERCKAIDAARAERKPITEPKPDLPPGESSSKSSQLPGASPNSCSPEDVLEAEHDVDVGDTYVELGNLKAAEMRYRDALKALPEDPVATLHLARLLEKQGRKEEALQMYQSYMTWSPTGKDADQANKSIAKLGTEK